MQSIKAGLEAVLKAPEYLKKPCTLVASAAGSVAARPFKVGLFLTQFIIDFCSHGGISEENSSSFEAYSFSNYVIWAALFLWMTQGLLSVQKYWPWVRISRRKHADFEENMIKNFSFILNLDSLAQFALLYANWNYLDEANLLKDTQAVKYLNKTFPEALAGSHATCAFFLLVWCRDEIRLGKYENSPLRIAAPVPILLSVTRFVLDNPDCIIFGLKIGLLVLLGFASFPYLESCSTAVSNVIGKFDRFVFAILDIAHTWELHYPKVLQHLRQKIGILKKETEEQKKSFHIGLLRAACVSIILSSFLLLSGVHRGTLSSLVFVAVITGATVSLDWAYHSTVATEQVIKFAKLFIADSNYHHGLIFSVQLTLLGLLGKSGYISLSLDACFGSMSLLFLSMLCLCFFDVKRRGFDVKCFGGQSIPLLNFFLWNVLVAAIFQSNLPGYGTFTADSGWKGFSTFLLHLFIFNPMIIRITLGFATILDLLTSTSSMNSYKSNFPRSRKSDRWELALVTVKVMLCMYCLLFIGMSACRLMWLNFTASAQILHPFHKLTTLVISVCCVLVAGPRAYTLDAIINFIGLQNPESCHQYQWSRDLVGDIVYMIFEQHLRSGQLPKKIISTASDDCVVCLESLSDLSSADCDDLDIVSKVDKLQALGTRVFRCGHATHANCWNMWMQQQQRQRATGPKKCLCCQAEVE